jgi:hypothetical protein
VSKDYTGQGLYLEIQQTLSLGTREVANLGLREFDIVDCAGRQ